MSIPVAERALEISLAKHAEVDAQAIEGLLSAVLSARASYHPRALDGLSVSTQVRTTTNLDARAIAVMIDGQFVEPVVCSLVLGANGQVQAGSTLQFGGPPNKRAIYGTPAHDRLVSQLLAEPPNVGQWAHEFVRTSSNWERRFGVA